MVYNIKVTHTAPTFKQFAEWGIQKAFPTFYINIAFHKKKKEELLFKRRRMSQTAKLTNPPAKILLNQKTSMSLNDRYV
jgi:hypothetical protein